MTRKPMSLKSYQIELELRASQRLPNTPEMDEMEDRVCKAAEYLTKRKER